MRIGEMEIIAKTLCRVQLVNWHFFENERIALNGSTLISGENTSGKSTVLDAIQLVLTTNSRKFNMAANEKGNRDLKGYVRCKVGNEDETYHRKGTVPANVALEFYEEKTDSYFVLGVHLLSQDEESLVVKRWYAEECRLEDLSFITGGRPSLAEEFRNKTRRIKYMDTDKAARDRFRHRMGNLDEKFFDIIPKSLAFKPMDNVKQFINKFVLSENRVDVESLRNNISLLDDLENTLNKTKKQLEALTKILAVFDAIERKDRDLLINDILLKLADLESVVKSLEEDKRDIELKKQTILGIDERLQTLGKKIHALEDEILNLKVSISNNEAGKLVESLKRHLDELTGRLREAEGKKRQLERETQSVAAYVKTVNKNLSQTIDGLKEIGLFLEEGYEEEKNRTIRALEEHFEKEFPGFTDQKARMNVQMDILDQKICDLRQRQKDLEKRKLPYPSATQRLKSFIEDEYPRQGIQSKVYILSDLLEITDERWRNAVEGYFNTQKFYLVVEPEYYNVALRVYDKNRDTIHSAGIINTRRLPQDYEENSKSLAYVVKADNRYAAAYVQYVLGRVIRCDTVRELEEYKIAITPECMLYQGYVVRHLNPKDYRDPYIGINAYRVQLDNVLEQLERLTGERKALREESAKYSEVLEAGRKASLEMQMLRHNLLAPTQIGMLHREIADAKAELKIAEKDPTLIELTAKLNEKEAELKENKAKRDAAGIERTRLDMEVEGLARNVAEEENQIREKKNTVDGLYETAGAEYAAAQEKYRQNRKTKEPRQIFLNFSPQRTQFENERVSLEHRLYEQQVNFNSEFSLDFTTGTVEAARYQDAADKLAKVEIVKHEEELRSAKADCERIFRSDFLSKMREHIENARQEFKNLNRALENVYYGEDSYYFRITFDKRKESLYRMITSEYNMEGENNLWTSAFEAEYKDEIEDLFAKLMVGDDKGEKVIEEYTDYRSYLDYDIEIRKKNGQRQRFSDIYGEKSGSETQVRYYVAIAASFYQLYRYGNSVRLMLLDEAFDKMDDDRIKSMLEFMNDLKLQVIMATPPQKIEVIGEHVGCVLTAIREGNRSIIEEYDL